MGSRGAREAGRAAAGSERSPARAGELADTHAALRESEERFRAFMDNTPAVAFLKDEEGRIVWVNRRFERTFGTRLEEIRGRSDAERWPPEIAQRLTAVHRQVLAGGVPVQLQEKLPTPAGERCWLSLKFPFQDGDGRRFLGGVSVDVTEQRNAEEARERSRSVLQATLESSADGILAIDAHDRVVAYNRRFCEMWRIPPALIAEEDNVRLLAFVKDQLADPGGFFADVRRPHAGTSATLLRFKDGRVFERYAVPQYLGDSIIGRVCTFRDVTERLRLEEHLRQALKMEAVGQLAGGVAHDFNNLLTVIAGYAAMVTRELPAEGRARTYVEEITRAAERAAALTRQLLAFSRQQVMQPRVLDLNALLHEMRELLRRIVREDIELSFVPGPDLGDVMADPTQIEQVVMNLVVNARDAMPGGGKLTLTTSRARLEGGEGGGSFNVATGDYVQLTVADTGIGMDETTLSRAFEPFFTTKDKGQGTGLGLSTVYGIVKQSGGYVWLESEPGQGCRVHVYLPRSVQPAPSRGLVASGPVAASGSGETVVVAEDEEAVRSLVVEVLQGCGYRVLAAAGGRQALALCRRHRRGSIHLLLTDVVMPGMSGPELTRQVARIHPEIRILYMSGYTDRAIARPGPDLQLIEKPFHPSALARRVREVLDAPPHSGAR
jgi:two-component system, cell cycle sensor histidine kinase and response regulator CckA